MSVKIPTTRTTSRDGVNAAQTFFEHNGCVFQEVAQQNDFGKDAYVDLSDGRTVTHLCIAVQIKSGGSYRTTDGDYFVPVDNHSRNWRLSTVPVFALVYDPDDRLLRWGDLTGHLRSNPSQDTGTIPVSRDAFLTADSLRGSFMQAVKAYAHDTVGSIASGLLSETEAIQADAVYDAWALGRHDSRYLLLLRRLIIELRGPSVRRAIIALSHATPHPDIFWTNNNWIPEAIKVRARASFRWSPREVAHMLDVVGDDDWGRGTVAESLDMLIREDPDCASVLDSTLGMLLVNNLHHAASGAALLLLAYSEDPRATLTSLAQRYPGLQSDDWFREIADTVKTWGAISPY